MVRASTSRDTGANMKASIWKVMRCQGVSLMGVVGLGVCAAWGYAVLAQDSINVDSNGAGAALAAVAKANAITAEGKAPFHLKLSFQVFDMKGKPAETGTAEEWWYGVRNQRVLVTTPSVGTLTNPGLEATANESARRTLFLVQKLLDAVTNPAAYISTDPQYVTLVDQKREVHGLKLECVQSVPVKQKAQPSMAPNVCWQTDDGVIRLMSSQDESIARNKIGRFAGTWVGIDTQLAYGDRQAITGHIEALNGIAPSRVPVDSQKSGKAEAEPGSGGQTIVPSAVLAGKLLNRVQPEYPMMARQERISGTVVLSALISPQGTIERLTPIASPSELLTDAAVEAVKQWTYTPYLLNGVPTAVDTTITVNFNIGSRL